MLAPWQTEPPSSCPRPSSTSAPDARWATTTSPPSRHSGIVPHRAAAGTVAVSQLSVGLGLLDLGFPTEAALAAAEVYAAHGRAIAEELYELFRTMVWPAYKESGASPERSARSSSGSSRCRWRGW